MRTLAWKILSEFGVKYADVRAPLREWFLFVERASWGSFSDLRETYRSAEAVGNKVIFNIKGNSYRLIAIVNYHSKHVLIRWVGTHAEYDRLTEREIEDL